MIASPSHGTRKRVGDAITRETPRVAPRDPKGHKPSADGRRGLLAGFARIGTQGLLRGAGTLGLCVVVASACVLHLAFHRSGAIAIGRSEELESLWNDHEMAVTALDFAAKRSPQEPMMRLLEAREFRAMGKPREALRAIEAAMAWDPTNPMLVNEKGVLEYQLGRFAEAEREFVGVLRLVEGASAVRMAIAVNGRRRSGGGAAAT